MHKANQSIRNRLLVARLPAMPQILVKLIDLCQQDDAGMGQVAKLIAHDAGMTARVLGIANSSAYSHSSLQLGLVQSLNTLGIEMIKTLVINESVFQTFSSFSRLNRTDLRSFWLHALKTAVIARELAKKMSYPRSEEAYLAGLLHDVGRLALLSAAPHEYSSNFMAEDDEHLCSIETSSMGISHTEAGAWLIEQWNLDSFLADSVLYHHEPIARLLSAHPLIRLVCLAHLLGSYKSDSPALEGAAALCAIDETDIQAILSGVNAYTKTAATYFGIDLTDADQVSPSAEYVPQEPGGNRVEDRLADEVRNMALLSASVQTFSSMRNGKDLLESITRSARILFNFEDMVVFLQDANSQALVGFPIGDRQQRLSGFSIPLASGGIIAEAVSNRRITFAEHDDSPLGLVEEQLLRAMGTECLAYIPLITGQSCLGVLVGGLSSVQFSELWGQERFLKSFATQAATSLESSTAARSEIEKHIAKVNEAHRDASRKIVHEVNNPLSIIKNYLGVLDDKLANQEPVNEELSILNEEIDRVSRIVGGFANPDSPLKEDTTEVNGVLKDVVRLFSISRFLPASVKIVVKTTDQPDVMPGSADPLKQILLNLIKNAVEALPKGGVIGVRNNGRITREGRAYIELRISDNGAGIPADVLANLFSPVRSSKGGENRGLGLNIVQGLVNKINGIISCRSGESGTTFEILLPAHNATGNYGSEPKQISKHGVS
jgi:HD-like signal output (HDOD) protein/signal transduction histidine kinase